MRNKIFMFRAFALIVTVIALSGCDMFGFNQAEMKGRIISCEPLEEDAGRGAGRTCTIELEKGARVTMNLPHFAKPNAGDQVILVFSGKTQEIGFRAAED